MFVIGIDLEDGSTPLAPSSSETVGLVFEDQEMRKFPRSVYRTVALLHVCLVFTFAVPAYAGDTVTIGLMAELTGQFSRLGEDCRRGYEVAQRSFASDSNSDELNLRFVLGDNQGLARPGLSEFRRLAEFENAVAVVTTRSPVGLAVNPISKKLGISLIGIVGHPDFVEDNDFAFRIWPSAAAEGAALADKAKELKKTRAAVVTLDDDYFLGIAKVFKKRFSQLGGQIVASEIVLPENHDFSTLIARLIQQQPDLVLVNVGPVQAGTFVRRLRELGFTGTVMSNFLLGTPDALHNAGEAAEGAIFIEVNFEKAGFLSQIKKHFGDERSSPIGYSCFVGLSAVIQAIKQSTPVPGRKKVHDALKMLDKITVPDGTVEMIEREAQLELIYRVIRDGSVSKL